MYNRYIRDDQGRYERVPQQEAPAAPARRQPPPPPPGSPPFSPPMPPTPAPSPPPSHTPSLPDLHFFDQLLDRFHMKDLDSGDLLLLAILFLLFRQEADEEILIALGLLLIL